MIAAFGLKLTCFAKRVCRNDRKGSRSVLRQHYQEGLFTGVEPTKSRRKRTSASECLLGVGRTYLGRLELRLLAMSRNMTFNAESLLS